MFDEILQWFSSHLSNLTDALVYCAIAGVTLIGVFKCLIPLITTTHALRRAITRLQQDAGTRQGTPVWQEKRFMGNRLKNCWLRFLQNAEQLDRRGLPCNVEDYINDDTVIHGPGNAQLADLIPGLLTSLGILGTFMGMMDGLGGLDFSNADKIIEGIPTLLTGMQFAFGTSVAGVSCSICFNIINRILQGSSYRAIDDFVSNFTSLAMSRPLDNDVQLICQNQDSNHMLSTLTDTLPGQLAGAMEHSVRSAMQPVSQAMDNFLMGATRAQVDGVGRIVGSFVQQMNARAAQLGCISTRFSCPHGLYDDGNVSTAQDMGKIAIACAQYEIYRQIADTLQYEIPATNLHAARSIRSTNKMLDPENSCYRAYIHGMKTGFTTKAGRCYVTAAQQGDTIYGLVILGSDRKNIYAEAAAILDWAFAGCPQQQAAA